MQALSMSIVENVKDVREGKDWGRHQYPFDRIVKMITGNPSFLPHVRAESVAAFLAAIEPHSGVPAPQAGHDVKKVTSN